jgi:hypothetical protein
VPEEEGDVAVGVQAGGDDDVQLGHLLRDPLDPRDVPAEADHGGIDDGGDPLGGERPQLFGRVGDAGLVAPPLLRVVLLHVGGEGEDVLVHVGRAQFGAADRAPHGRYLAHR